MNNNQQESKQEKINATQDANEKLKQLLKDKTGKDVSLKYKGLSFELALLLDGLEKQYFTWDLPVPFGNKEKGLNIYPIMLKDYDKFTECLDVLTIDRKDFTKMPSKGIEETKARLKMTDLDFIISLLDPEKPQGDMWIAHFVQLIELVFHVKNGMKCTNCGKFISYEDYRRMALEDIKKQTEEIQKSDNKDQKIKTPVIRCPECGGDGIDQIISYKLDEKGKHYELFVDGQKITDKDWNTLKNIILFQNLPDYRDTSYIDPSLKKDYEKQKEIKAKQSGNVTATLEKKIIALKVGAGYTNYEDIYNLTARKFLMEMATMDDLIMYKLLMQGRLCGFGGSKEPVEHWIYKEIKDVYADGGYVDKDALKNKMKGAV